MFEKSYCREQNIIDPPKSPLERGTLIPVPPFLRGARGDQNVMTQLENTCVYTVAFLRGARGDQ
ncbi:hypothetical protein NSP_18990 [Nodularia spumigena CCY9414]|nr:hypothetical protein NSP_18990 [Nodularia spumigena CCY9414]